MYSFLECLTIALSDDLHNLFEYYVELVVALLRDHERLGD
jgi:hypothetical protein